MAADLGLNRSPPKKSFKLKMCRKVAELTQVVHMLFTKNHEREIEIAKMVEIYEREIRKLAHGYEEKITALSNDVEVIKVTEERARHKLSQSEKECKFKLEQQKEFYIKELETAKKVNADFKMKNDILFSRVKDLEDEKASIKQKLENSYVDYQPPPAAMCKDSQGSRKLNDHMVTEESKQISLLKEQLRNEKLKHAEEEIVFDRQLAKLRSDLESMEIQMQNKIKNASRDLTATEKSRERVLEKNKQLESEIRFLNKKIKMSQQHVVQKTNGYHSENTVTSSIEQIPVNEEIERLKKEIKRYKLELSNREGNFNRMFTNTVPVRLDKSSSFTRSPSSSDKVQISFERLPTLTSEHVRRKTARNPRPASSVKGHWNTLHTLHS